jgi:hypothetical protein
VTQQVNLERRVCVYCKQVFHAKNRKALAAQLHYHLKNKLCPNQMEFAKYMQPATAAMEHSVSSEDDMDLSGGGSFQLGEKEIGAPLSVIVEEEENVEEDSDVEERKEEELNRLELNALCLVLCLSFVASPRIFFMCA